MKILNNKNDLLYAEICELTQHLGWGSHYYPTVAVFRDVMNATAHVAFIREMGQLISYGRVITDGMHAIFCDICVHPNYQGQGIGMRLMQHLIEKIKDKNYVSIGLFCEENNESVADFYKKLGFEESPGMELKKYMRVNWD